MIELNIKQVQRLSQEISKLKLKDSYLNRPFISFESKSDLKANAYIYASAICHQTHHLKQEDLNLVGWNYIEHVFSTLAVQGSDLLKFNTIESMKVEELASTLEQLFPIRNNTSETSLDRSLERAQLLKNICVKMHEHNYKSALEFVLKVGPLGIEKLYESLSELEAFKDPYKKKSTLFIKLIHQSGLVYIPDVDQAQPLMDYHMQRLLLRTGCIEINDEALSASLRHKNILNDDSYIREKCIEAIERISKDSGIGVLDLDDMFWAIGRSCCNENLLCVSGICDKSPCTTDGLFESLHGETCYLYDVCFGRKNRNYRSYWEPQVQTTYY